MKRVRALLERALVVSALDVVARALRAEALTNVPQRTSYEVLANHYAVAEP